MKKEFKILASALMVALLGLSACGKESNKKRPNGDYNPISSRSNTGSEHDNNSSSGDSNGSESDEKPIYTGVGETINVWATAKEQAVIETVVANYNATQTDEDNKFHINFTPVSEDDVGTTLSKDPTVEGAPALALVKDDQIYNLQIKNIILEIKGSYKESIIANSTEVAVKGASYGDKLLGFPVTSDNGYFLWYNKEFISDSEATTLESIIAKATTLNKTVLLDIGNGWYVNSFFHSPQVCGPDSLTWREDDNHNVVYTTSWDSDKAAAAAEAVSNLVKPAFEAGTLIGVISSINDRFADKSMIAAVSGSWREGDLLAAVGENLAATKLPTFEVNGEACQMASFTGNKVYVINKTRPIAEQKAAAALADLLTNKESQLVRFKKRGSIPCNQEALSDPLYTENATLSAAALGMQNQYAVVQTTSVQDRYWTIGENIGRAIRYGDTDGASWKEFLKYQMDILRNPQ